MSQILNKVRDVDPNNSDGVKEVVTSFFQHLPKHRAVECTLWLRTLEDIISRFPRFCVSHRGVIETHLAHFLNSNNYYQVIDAAKCAHLLQQVRSAQEKTITSKTAWREQMNALCYAAHTLIGDIFRNAVDIYKASGDIEKERPPAKSPLPIALAKIGVVAPGGDENRQSVLTNRLRNIFVFIQAMLVEIYPVAKPVRPQIILDVLARALSVSSGNNVTGTNEVLVVKTQALQTLDALVACLGPNLIPFSPLVYRFILQTLRWSSDNPSPESRQVRVRAYVSAGRWAGVARAAGGGLPEQLAADIAPVTRPVHVNTAAQPTKNMSKKAKRKLANRLLLESNIAAHAPGEQNKFTQTQEEDQELTIAALDCTEKYLTACGIFLKPASMKLLEETVVRACVRLCVTRGTRGAVGAGLLRVGAALRRLGRATHALLAVYSTLLTSPDPQISTLCSQALLDIRLHLHHAPPTLSCALQPAEDTTETEDRRRQVSDKNRAALESLLGADRVNDITNENEVITIADEPLSKKQRMESESDQISLSSESVQSIDSEDSVDGTSNTNQEVEIVDPQERNTDNQITTTDINDVNEVESEDNNAIDVEASDETEINDAPTQLKEIHEAKTQLPFNAYNDTVDDEDRPLSMEIVYDYPNNRNETVTVLERVEDDNLPSTNETDDVITCGQDVQNSQDAERGDNAEAEPKINGYKSPVKVVENGSDDPKDIESVPAKSVPSKDELSVEAMLADFVDEVTDSGRD